MAMIATRVKHFAVDTEDKPGVLAKLAKQLRDAQVNLQGLWGFGVGPGKAQIFLVPENATKTKEGLQKLGFQVKEGTCFHLQGEDRAGALCETLEKIAAAGLNVHAIDAIAVKGHMGGYLWVKPEEVEQIGKILSA